MQSSATQAFWYIRLHLISICAARNTNSICMHQHHFEYVAYALVVAINKQAEVY